MSSFLNLLSAHGTRISLYFCALLLLAGTGIDALPAQLQASSSDPFLPSPFSWNHGKDYPTVSQISLGASHSCALMNSTEGVRCWGENIYGQLGVGSMAIMLTIPGDDVLYGVRQIAAGGRHTCVLMKIDGGVRCWGWNSDGQLGMGNTINIFVPPLDDVLRGAIQVVTGGRHTCALMNGTGGVRCWGGNDMGQLGIGNYTNLLAPLYQNILEGVIQIAAGDSHTCALMNETGGVRCWGWNIDGQLGMGIFNESLPAPPIFDILTDVTEIAVYGVHSCALMKENGGVRCWGSNMFGELGVGDTNSRYAPPSGDVLEGAVHIAAGDSHTCALMHGTWGVRCWGSNREGQLGTGNITMSECPYLTRLMPCLMKPPTYDALSGVLQISVGNYHNCALMNTSRGVRCWGFNDNGQLGIGNTTDLLVPPSSDLLFPNHPQPPTPPPPRPDGSSLSRGALFGILGASIMVSAFLVFAGYSLYVRRSLRKEKELLSTHINSQDTQDYKTF